ncbi:hypothetical protein Rhow_008495 [Rhodococcus wratislaviensis]|uniref:Uncharacterized protein n=1 Tax=Rhodococcus wratislaviensis TaxID=44752 RepID=A0A402CKT4_RHOWR|nr:hypothetical protein [Rhodococcus wratislaviensis]GCE44197.1 hypothetical protein Rhow_008495 [Rhodococcus wratislaviensis]
MVAKKRNYPTALAAGPEHGDTGVRDALKWVVTQLEAQGGQLLVFAPGKQNVENHDLLREFTRRTGVAVGTWRGRVLGWSGGPVLAAWPDRQKLGEIAADPRTTALCVVPWAQGEVDAWSAATTPELLGPATAPQLKGEPLDPVVVEGLKTLTAMVNHGNDLTGALDRRDAVAVLRTLRDAGYRWNPERVYAWALGNDWSSGGAERLRDLATDFEKGKRPQLKGRSPFRPDIIEVWRSEASDA